MEYIIIVFVAVIMIVAILFVAIVRGRNDSQTIKRLNEDIDTARADSLKAMETAARADSDGMGTKVRLEELRTELGEAKEALDIAQRSLANAEKTAALERQSREEIQKRMDDWEKVQSDHMKHAQAAVAKHAEFRGNVTFVGTRDFFREKAVSPSGQAYHWNSNAETYYLIGDGMGKAMLRLMKNK